MRTLVYANLNNSYLLLSYESEHSDGLIVVH